VEQSDVRPVLRWAYQESDSGSPMAGFGVGLGEPTADSQSLVTHSGGILTDPWDWLMGRGAQLANPQGCLSCWKPTSCSSEECC